MGGQGTASALKLHYEHFMLISAGWGKAAMGSLGVSLIGSACDMRQVEHRKLV